MTTAQKIAKIEAQIATLRNRPTLWSVEGRRALKSIILEKEQILRELRG